MDVAANSWSRALLLSKVAEREAPCRGIK